MKPISFKTFIIAAIIAISLSCVFSLKGEETPYPFENPILFVKRHNYLGLHIYDTFYKWRPGGGIYVLENPNDAPEKHRIRTVIDENSPETLGPGVYSDPDLSWDAKKILFCFKGSQNGGTSIYEIGVDGTGLRRITHSDTTFCNEYCGAAGGYHDVMPAYLPDEKIVFTSTRYSGLVPCANNGVNILHVANADGSDIRPISVNNVNEFDPSIMSDGRILFGRWEYIDKTALTQQSLWTVFPDGTNETAQFANNLVFPEATLQPREVPGNPHLVCCTFTPHNSPPRGSIAMVDLRMGKDEITAITNFEHPDRPTFDRGESCDPLPLSENLVLYSGLPEGANRSVPNAIMLINRNGKKTVLFSDPKIDLHNPIVLTLRKIPPVLPDLVDRSQTTGHFFVQDVYNGMPEVSRGSIKWLRVIEETSRISPTPGPTVLNQTFLVSAALAFSSKNYLGIVPVEEDGSVHFTVPSGKAVYFQLLDKDYRLVRSMRTFIQAAPGTTRSCVGCHNYTTPTADEGHRFHSTLQKEPLALQPELWGSGPIDYPSMVQPIFDKHCVRCHGGESGIEAGLDLTGGWTENFSNSYENLVSRREVIYIAPLIGGIDCMNGTANYSAQILPPYAHGSGNSPLADMILHKNKETRYPNMSDAERNLVLAWIDTNGLYYGTWNYTQHGYTLRNWQKLKNELSEVMQHSSCAKCHADENGKITRFESDWFNLENPRLSRILRAPLDTKATDGQEHGYGLGFCRDTKVDSHWKRLRMVTTAGYEHGVKPLESFPSQKWKAWDKSGEPFISFQSTDDPVYRQMLRLIESARNDALATPRIDMPGAEPISGRFRQIHPTPIPKTLSKALPKLQANIEPDGVVTLSWCQSHETYGLSFSLSRETNGVWEPLGTTTAFYFMDKTAPTGRNRYALRFSNGESQSENVFLEIDVPEALPLPTVSSAEAVAKPGAVEISWNPITADSPILYEIHRNDAAASSDGDGVKIHSNPIRNTFFTDATGEPKKEYEYRVRAVSRRGVTGEFSDAMKIASLPEPREIVFEAIAEQKFGDAPPIVFPHDNRYNLSKKITVDFWVKIEEKTQMPVFVSFGRWNHSGWFVQWLGDHFRWHLNGVDCDGGTPELNRWIHLRCNYDGTTMRIYQDGKQVAERPVQHGAPRPWTGPLYLGNYSGGPGDSYQLKGQIRSLRITNDARAEFFQDEKQK